VTLTKSLFTAGQQCHKLLWWKAHEPGAVELQPDKVLQDRFDQGAQVGALARNEFAGGVLIDLHQPAPDRIAITQGLVAAREGPIFEGTFEADGVRINADVLLPDGDGWRMIEVKSASSQKPEHIPDAAVQAWVLKQNGVEVIGVEIMHLNKDFKHPDQGALLVRTDVTPEVMDTIDGIPAEVARQLAMLDGPTPELAIGVHCDEPRECPFHSRCWPAARDHIAKLHSLGPKKTAAQMAAGVHKISDYQEKLPKNGAISNQTLTIRRQVRSMKEDRLIVEPGLAQALELFSGCLGFLDFETISRAVPVWPGMSPWEQAAAQFSYHEAQADGSYSHAEFLAEGPDDARPKLAKAMVEATANAERVVMYTSFEKTRIRSLQQTVPALRAELEALEAKLIDLHPVIQHHVYHPAFEGSFSLKYVLPALVPGVSYKDLVIVNGLVASVEIARLLFVAGMIPEAERARVRQDLLDYCERDTWAMVKLLETLFAVRASVDP
jgi:predicted RecB family nuclease